MWKMEGHILDELNLFEKVPSEQKPGLLKEGSHRLMGVRKNNQGGKSKCGGHEVGVRLACWIRVIRVLE